MSTPAPKYTAEQIYNLVAAGKSISPEFVNIRDERGNTALLLAASKGDIGAINLLLTLGAHVAAKNNDGNTALHLAAKNGLIDAIQTLLTADADLATKNGAGNTPLHYAALCGHTDAIHTLIQTGADPRTENNAKETPLYCAASKGHLDAMQALFDAGAGLWEGALASARAEKVFSLDVLTKLNDLEKLMFEKPLACRHLNFNGFPQKFIAIPEVENCLVTVATHYTNHPAELRTLETLGLEGLSFAMRGIVALACIIEKGTLTHLSLANTRGVTVSESSYVGRALISNSSIKILDLSSQTIKPQVLEVVDPLIRKRQLKQLTLLTPDFTQKNIAMLDAAQCNKKIALSNEQLPAIYLSHTSDVVKGLAKASHNLSQATRVMMNTGVLCSRVPALQTLIRAQLKTFFPAPKTDTSTTATPVSNVKASALQRRGLPTARRYPFG